MGPSCTKCHSHTNLNRKDHFFYAGESVLGCVHICHCDNHGRKQSEFNLWVKLKCTLTDPDAVCTDKSVYQVTGNQTVAAASANNNMFINSSYKRVLLSNLVQAKPVNCFDHECRTNDECKSPFKISYTFEIAIPLEAPPTLRLSRRSRIEYYIKFYLDKQWNNVLIPTVFVTVIPRASYPTDSLENVKYDKIGNCYKCKVELNSNIHMVPSIIMVTIQMSNLEENSEAADSVSSMKSKIEIIKKIRINNHFLNETIFNSGEDQFEKADDAFRRTAKFLLSNKNTVPTYKAVPLKGKTNNLGIFNDLQIDYKVGVTIKLDNDLPPLLTCLFPLVISNPLDEVKEFEE